jgi:hypothetical protein
VRLVIRHRVTPELRSAIAAELERRAFVVSATDYRDEQLVDGPCIACGADLVGDRSALLCPRCSALARAIAKGA